MSTLKRNILPLLLITIAAILFASLVMHRGAKQAGQKGSKADVAYVTDSTPATEVDWSMIGQAIAALISAIAGIVQLVRDLFGKGTANSHLIQDTIQHGGTLTPTAETLGDDLVAFTNQTGSGPAYELAMRVAGEKLLRKYTITVKP